ncbi:hypothetical protein HDE_06138 [Halotydeus destructor]|nr:hypothetical protein HDE_06138 [Halotydeus destructor]
MESTELPEVKEMLQMVIAGDVLFKVCASNKYVERKYWLDPESLCISYSSLIPTCNYSTNKSSFNLMDAVEILQGRKTKRFKSLVSRIEKMSHNGKLKNEYEMLLKDEKCFSIIFKSKTIDLVAKTQRKCECWTTALKYIIEMRERWIDELQAASVNEI